MKTRKLTFDQPQSLAYAGELHKWGKGDHDVPEQIAVKLIRAGAAREHKAKSAKTAAADSAS